ncbi:MAG TPA: methionine--tRNA ligase [Candidatus Levybacteria bacterium]|nr:methionine--tRNA ligase [Candidatus Levybacteria bacterium]
MTKFYLTTAIPYVNGKPHLGHALEYFQADTIRRFYSLLGRETLLLSGADENALKNVQAAEVAGMETQEFLDKHSQIFKEAFSKLGVQLDVFQRGSDQKSHWPGVQKLWMLCEKHGDIYKKSYEGLYCVGCESFKTSEELTPDGLCPDHLKKPEIVKEENYFFKLSRYQKELEELIESNTLSIIPDNKRAETLSFIKQGLEDFSISRSKERARGVGVPVPGDDTQVMYVWFDALTIYMTGVGYGSDEEKWKKWWPADLHIIGKDINRFHTIYWPAMLLSAKLPLHKQVLIHSFITAPGGQKMSKTLGNVVDPFDMAAQFGLEPFRYYLLSQIPLADDGEASVERFKEVYSADLANGLGNLVARVAKLAEKNAVEAPDSTNLTFSPTVQESIAHYRFAETLGHIWKVLRDVDKQINLDEPWKISDTNTAKKTLLGYIQIIQQAAYDLQPLIPETATKILTQFSGSIQAHDPLFPRLPSAENTQ